MDSQGGKVLSEENESNSIEQIEKLSSQISMSNSQILWLASSSSKLSEKIEELNDQGVDAINEHRFSQGLVYLQEAEKILEYAASCGKTIDRFLITTTLQNEACAYQRLWELDKASDYMQAIIYNLRLSLQCFKSTQLREGKKDLQMLPHENLSNFVSSRIDGVFYFLQISAINSQLKKHQLSIKSIQEAMVLLKDVCNECLKYQRVIKGKNSYLMEEFARSFEISGYRVSSLMREIKQTLQNLDTKKAKLKLNFDPETIQNFSIGEVMQIGTLTIEEAKQKNNIDQEMSNLGILYKFFYLSICFFALATETRLQSKNSPLKESGKSIQYDRSKLYHLYSIKLILNHIPLKSEYLSHILKSFEKNYDINLENFQEDIKEISSIQIESINSKEKLAFTSQKLSELKLNQKMFMKKRNISSIIRQMKSEKKSMEKTNIQKIQQTNKKIPKNLMKKKFTQKTQRTISWKEKTVRKTSKKKIKYDKNIKNEEIYHGSLRRKSSKLLSASPKPSPFPQSQVASPKEKIQKRNTQYYFQHIYSPNKKDKNSKKERALKEKKNKKREKSPDLNLCIKRR